MYLIFLFADGARTNVLACDAEDALETMRATLAKNGITGATHRYRDDGAGIICDIPMPAPDSFKLALCVDLGRMA